jgi:hypothetical protein
MMRQGDLSADIIQKLVDSLQRISLVTSSAASYQPATKSGAGSSALVRNQSDTTKSRPSPSSVMDDLFPDDAVVDENDEGKKSETPEISTDAFADKKSKLDVDRAFARLQAREARSHQADPPSGVSALSEDGIGVAAGLNDDGFLEEESNADLASKLPEEVQPVDTVDDSAEDMEKARSVQNHLLGGIPQIPGVEIGMVYEPVTQLGGDFYFVHKIDDDRFFFMLAALEFTNA